MNPSFENKSITAAVTGEAPLMRDFVIVNQRGLHARASVKFSKLIDGYDVEVEVEKDGMRVGGRSIMGLMMLAASSGCTIRVHASGPDAEPFLGALETLIGDRFGEEC